MTDVANPHVAVRASEERFHAIFDSVYDGIIVEAIDTNAILDVNLRVCEMYGYTRAEVRTLTLIDLLADSSPAMREKCADVRARTRGGARAVYEVQFKTKDGHRFWGEIAVRRAPFGGNDVLLSMVRNVTKRHEATAGVAYRERIIHAITVRSAALVVGPSIPIAMAEALKAIAEVMGIDRIAIIEDSASTVPAAVIPAFLWQRSAQSMHSRSNLLVPILVAGKHWGHIGVDDCTTARIWSPVEIDAIGTFAQLSGAVIVREQARVALRRSEERFRAVSEAMFDAVFIVDSRGSICYWNRAAERMFGYSAVEATGKGIVEFLMPEELRAQGARIREEFLGVDRGSVMGRTVELVATRKDGIDIATEVSLNAMALRGERFAVGVVRDITERNQTSEAIARMARYDDLTGLANRAFFLESLDQAIKRVHRGGNPFAVVYFDLDHFKDVNDTLGHPVGDLLLRAVADRLRACARDGDVAARFGGDEFALLALELPEPVEAARVAEELARELNRPFPLGAGAIRTGASFGIALYGPESRDAETLLLHADSALYRAKREGRGTYRFFTAKMDGEIRTRLAMGDELRDAIAHEGLSIVYQPQVEISTGRIIGIEALSRWHSPTRGEITPSTFIPLAESNGTMVALGHWVLRTAVRQAKHWLTAGIAPPLVSVNLSGVQFNAPAELESDISQILEEFALPPSRLEVELTESMLFEESREQRETLLALRALGLRIAIDDFGNGYSSLAYLRRFPVDRLKIPGNFIADLSTGSKSAPIVRATLGLARDLGIQVIAEGVETDAQLALLKSWGCEQVQGFYFSKPLTASEATAVLRVGVITPPRSTAA